MSVALLAQILQMRFGRDQGIYAMVAAAILEGDMPYRDAWDFKPPGIYLVYAAAQAAFGRNQWGIRLLEAASLASLWPAFWLLARRSFGDLRVGSLAFVLTILMAAELEFWHTAQPESFGGVLAIWGLVAVAAAGKQPSPKSLLALTGAAGALFGVGAMMKPHFGAGVVVAAGYLLHQARRGRLQWRSATAGLAVCLGAAAAPACLVLGWFRFSGAMPELVDTLFVFAPGYVALTFQAADLLSLTYSAFTGATCGFCALVPVGIVAALASPRCRDTTAAPGLVLASALALPQILGIAMQAKFFPYHFAGVLPLVAWLAAPGLVWLWDTVSRRWGRPGRWSAVAAGAALLASATSTRDLQESFLMRSLRRTRALLSWNAEERERAAAQLYSVADVSYGANVQVARWMAEHSEPGDRFYLYGFEPFVYYLANRKPGSRFIYNVPQRSAWSKHWARPALISDLQQHRPKYIAILRYDVFPMVTGDLLDSRASSKEFPALGALLAAEYAPVEQIEDFEIYERLHAAEPWLQAGDRP